MTTPAAEVTNATSAGDRGKLHVDPMVWDALATFAFTAAAFAFVVFTPTSPGFRGNDVLGIVLLLAMSLPLFLVRTYPVAVFLTVGVASIIGAAYGYPSINVGYLAGAVALFVVAVKSHFWRSMLAALAASGTLIAVYAFLWDRGTASIPRGIASWFIFCGVWVIGVALHAYRENVDEARERAHQERERADLYLHDLEMHAMEAVTLERARVARELHDIVGHTLNVVVVQAGAAQRLLEKKPQVAREALETIESSSRQALIDIERMLGILRAEEGEAEEMGAQPGLAGLARFLDQVREAGLPVELEVSGDVRELPQSVDLSAYRIVQEAMTNTLKHAGAGARSRVTVTYRDEDLCIEAVDDGGGRPRAAVPAPGGSVYVGGRGLVGMRERVLLFGGRLEVGPLPERGFRVFACLPIAGPFGRRAGSPSTGGDDA